MDQTSVDFVRNSPWYVFYPFILLIVGIMAFMMWTVLVTIPKAGRSTSKKAKWIADRRWYVKDVKGWATVNSKERWGFLELHSDDAQRTRLTLPIRPGHPDLDEFMKLQRLEIIEFDFLAKPLECALDVEFCAFLRLKGHERGLSS